MQSHAVLRDLDRILDRHLGADDDYPRNKYIENVPTDDGGSLNIRIFDDGITINGSHGTMYTTRATAKREVYEGETVIQEETTDNLVQICELLMKSTEDANWRVGFTCQWGNGTSARPRNNLYIQKKIDNVAKYSIVLHNSNQSSLVDWGSKFCSDFRPRPSGRN